MVVSRGSLSDFGDIPKAGVLLCMLFAPLFQLGPYGNLKRGVDSGESNLSFFLLAIFSIIGPAFVIPFFSRGTKFSFPAILGYAGLLFFVAGYWIRFVSIRELKKQFSVYVAIQEDHQLITTGIYSAVRHPIYLGVILSSFGMLFVFPSILGLIFVLLYSMLLIGRMAREEKLLLKHFGSVYEEYSLKSHRLIPHIY